MAKHEAGERGRPDRSAGKKPPVAKPAPDLRNSTPARDAHAPSAAEAPAWNFSAIPVSRAPVSLQPKLEVGAVNDPLEREAERAADQVTRMPEPSNAGAKLQSQASASAGLSQAGAPPTVHEALRSPSRPLDPELRAFMEPRFGHDFSQVRLHSGTAAGESARALNAHAYTLGQDIVFGSGRLAPSTNEGSRLLAHELTHVVQQGRGAQQIQRDQGPGDDPEYATGAEVEKALINYLNTAWEVQGGRFLQVDENVRTAVAKLAGSAAVDPNDLLHLSVEEFAKRVRAVLPEKIPRSQMVHLYKLPEKKRVPSKSWVEKKKEEANKKLDEVGKPPEDVRPPNGPTYPPGGEPNIGGSQGQHVSPPKPVDSVGDWIDKGTGGPIKKNPPPSQPQGTPPSSQDSDANDPAPAGIGHRRRDLPDGPFLRSPLPAAPGMDLGESLAESASPLTAAAIGSVTIDGFVTGEAEIPGGQVDRLKSTATIIRTLLRRYPASTIRVTGHTDAVGKGDDNQSLGQSRADNAQAFLVAQGIPAEAIRTQSAGEIQLLVKTQNAEPKNRRVEIQFETSTLLRNFGRSSGPRPAIPLAEPKKESEPQSNLLGPGPAGDISPGGGASKSGEDQWSLQAGPSVVHHVYLSPKSPADPLNEWMINAQGALTKQRHGPNQSGREDQSFVTAQYSFTTKQWTIGVGEQVSYVFQLPHDLQLSFWTQLFAGQNLATGGTQGGLSAGSQILWQPKSYFAVSAQGATGPTVQSPGPTTIDFTGTISIQIMK